MQPSSTSEPVLTGGSTTSTGDAATFGVVTVSDRASSGVYEDLSGPSILQFFHEAVASPWTAKYVVIPDEQQVIEATLKDLVRKAHSQRVPPCSIAQHLSQHCMATACHACHLSHPCAPSRILRHDSGC